MKRWGGGQLDIRPPNLKIGGDVSPPSPQDWRPWIKEQKTRKPRRLKN